jgi:hypothetical protein
MIRTGSYFSQQVLIAMNSSTSLVSYIESAVDRTPYCACGATMIPADHDGALYLECVRHDEEKHGITARLWALFGHDRQLLMAADELAA